VLYTAGFSTDRVYAIDASPHEYGGPVSKPNFVAVTPWGSLLVSNDFSADISEITAAGRTGVWTRGVNSPNGMAFSADGSSLYVVSTFDATPSLWKVPVAGSHRAGAPVRVTAFAGSPTPDGIAPVADGSMLVALNVAGKLVRVNVNDGAVTEVARGLTFPASLAFGEGDFDPCSVYVTQLAGKGVHRVAVGAMGGKLYR
jgi:sugar lactone lactonase YvrE